MTMKCKKLFAPVLIVALGLVAIVSIVIAEPSKDAKTAGQPEMKLPPGWTEDDMKACAMAGTPGKMHEHLAKSAGVWQAKTTMWMAPDTEPMTSEGSSKVKTIMDGRYIKCEMDGEMPGMGPYKGLGFYGYDNISKKFVSVWLDNHSTGIMQGTGELSEDGKTLTWKYTHNCPITGKPTVMREVETITGPDTRTLEMFGPDPKTGKEHRCMRIELTRKPGARVEK
jgi:hypothetical protein